MTCTAPRVGKPSSWRTRSRVEPGIITSLKVPGWSPLGKIRSPVTLFTTERSTVAVSWTLPVLVMVVVIGTGVVIEKPGKEVSSTSPE